MLTQCDYCNAKFRNKELLSNHILIHNVADDGQINKFICIVCKMKFPNKVLLNQHMSRVHNKNQKFSKRKRTQPKKHTCVACLMKFQYVCQLKYHIRKQHFNLTGQTPYCDLKSINQVWFEKVLNTNVIVEIKKLGHNYLLIRKLNENTSIKVTDSEREVFDLRVNYPLSSETKVLTKQGMASCRLCSKVCTKKHWKKHIEEFHRQQ